MGAKHSLFKSFKYAGAGLFTAIQNEPNMRIHLVIGTIAVILGFVLGLNYIEWLIITLAIFLVIILELINTILENLVNIVSPQFNDYAKKAKDISAAAVLVAAIFSVIVGVILFIPKVLLLFGI